MGGDCLSDEDGEFWTLRREFESPPGYHLFSLKGVILGVLLGFYLVLFLPHYGFLWLISSKVKIYRFVLVLRARAILAILADGRPMTCRENLEVTGFNLIPRAD